MKTSAIKIKAGVPIPPSHLSLRPSKYPYANMKKGDSFWAKTSIYNLLQSSKTWSKRRGYKWEWEARVEKKGARLWRIK